MKMDYAAAQKVAKESGGQFISLKNDGDSVVGVFAGDEVEVHHVTYNQTTKKYDDYTPDMAAKGMSKSSRFKLHFFVIAEGVTKIFEANAATFETICVTRNKYGNEAPFEIKRRGAAGDTKTSYMIMPEPKPLTPEQLEKLKTAARPDLTEAGSAEDSAATDMNSHDKSKSGTAAAPAGNGASAPAPTGLISPETSSDFVGRIKKLERPKIHKFLNTFKVAKCKEIKLSDQAAAEALLLELEGKAAPPPAAAAAADEWE